MNEQASTATPPADVRFVQVQKKFDASTALHALDLEIKRMKSGGGLISRSNGARFLRCSGRVAAARPRPFG